MVKRRNLPASSGDEEKEVDRISNLPDELIHYILSFNDTKYAVQTSVLSKRWIDIWKSLPFLNFHRSLRVNTKKFIDFVYMVFLLRDNSNVQRFSVDWENSAYDNTVMKNVNRWSLNAIKYHVQEIRILITECHGSVYEIPHQLLNCKSLKELVIQVHRKDNYLLYTILPRSMSLPQLKVLCLSGLSIPDVELSKRLFSSCPVLETLYISDCNIKTDNQRNLIVDSVRLKKFDYGFWSRHPLPQNGTMANVIKLCAPNLEVFTFRFFLAQDYSLEICCPLSGVYFDMILEEDEYSELPSGTKEVYAQRITKFLEAVCMVKAMILSPGFLEVLSKAPDLLDCQPPSLCNLRYLTLEMWFTRDCLRAMAYLLSISPKITNIVLESKESNSANMGDDWDAGLLLPGMLSHLKSVQINEVEGCDNELKFLSFLLKHAMVLKKVVLCPRSTIESPDSVRRHFRRKLRALPRASSRIRMEWPAEKSIRI